MNIVRFAEAISVSFRKSAGGAHITFESGRDYVIANAQLDRVMQDQNVRDRVYKVSRMDNRIPNFHVSLRKPGSNRLLLYNGSGGYGDQIMTWPFARILSQLGFEVHILTDPGNNVCWWNFPWVKTINLLPLPYETVKLFDWFVCFETVVNADEHGDQLHPLDLMLTKVGLDPAAIEDKMKVVNPMFTYAEMMAAKPWENKPFAIYQLAAANPVRCLPPNDSVFMLCKLAEAFPEVTWLAIYDEFVPKDYTEILKTKMEEMKLTNIQPFTAANLRELWCIAHRSLLAISPDSMLIHLAGCIGLPCVGLWGPVNPTNRVKYYTNHTPIWHQEFCVHAPCFCYQNVFPRYCPPRPERKVCEVLAGISPAEVIETSRKIIQLRQTAAAAARAAE